MLQTLSPILPVSDLCLPANSEIVQQLTKLEEYPQTERQIWSQLSQESLRRVWDNPQDAVYDEWRMLYSISA